MKKYIIKNCPCFNEGHPMLDFYGECLSLTDDVQVCKDCTDCVMKQIVELCNGIKCPCEYKGADCWECTESGARRFADKILKLLDIKEVDD